MHINKCDTVFLFSVTSDPNRSDLYSDTAMGHLWHILLGGIYWYPQKKLFGHQQNLTIHVNLILTKIIKCCLNFLNQS